MTKGIAIQTILMLLVGILVVGIIVYVVYRYFVGAPLGEQECRARLTSWCSSCKVMNYSYAGYALGQNLVDCIDNYGFWTSGTFDATDTCEADGLSYATLSGFCAQFTP